MEEKPARVPFLTARWMNLALFTYEVSPAHVARYLPGGLEPDLKDGSAFVSLVVFDFADTRVLGVPWPGHTEFPEINLRTYVRNGQDRGVVFIREIVPKQIVAMLAKLIYNEPYSASPLKSTVERTAERIAIDHRLSWQGVDYTIQASGKGPVWRPGDDSVEHFFKEHKWGYGRAHNGRLLKYRVWHPVWDVYAPEKFTVDLDWRHVYGSDWGALAGRKPDSVILAAGSEIAVYPWR